MRWTCKNALLLLLCIVTICSYQPLTKSQVSRDDEKLSEASRNAADKRETRINKELEKLNNHEWAGEYYFGDGLGVNVTLRIAPKSGFVFTWTGCLGLYDLNYGDVELKDGKVKLLLTHPNERKGFQGTGEEFIPVKWGERHYLIPSDEMLEFVNAVNGGFEPCSFMCARFLLRDGDRKKNVNGKPNIPNEYVKYLLKEPIRTTVTSVGDNIVVKEIKNKDWQYRTTKVILGAGSKQGVWVGMEFHVYSPREVSETVKVTKVGETFSEAEIVQMGSIKEGIIGDIPSVGWKLTTSLDDIK